MPRGPGACAAFGSIAVASVVLLFAGEARAYSRYDGCRTCHGDFRSSPYTPPGGGIGVSSFLDTGAGRPDKGAWCGETITATGSRS